jgi:hypothetical protein
VHPRTSENPYTSPTVTLAILGSMTFRWSHVRVANIGHFRAILGPQKGVSALLNASTRPKCHCRTRHLAE